jgi:4-amino-4-deoxy-L-arabinose transferase-like glycosyltransferase
VAAGLRLAGIGAGEPDPYYDAAVRSMGTSWHALLVGAFEPGARVAIDKPPVDLWLQVASTRLFGFTTTALVLPAAIAGTLTVLALYDLGRVLFGPRAGIAAAAAFAVLPIAVITARSDTMDSVMAMLVTVAAALTARAARSGRPWLAVAAGAVLGLAFEVKLFEALVAAPALVALWWWAAEGTTRRRVGGLVGAGAAFTVVALAWLCAVSLVPAGSRPYALGSTNGSAWNAVFVYDGIDRVGGGAAGRAARVDPPTRPELAAAPGPPGAFRLLSPRASLAARIGLAVVAAVVALALGAAFGGRGRLTRVGRAGLAALAVWLACGAVLASAMQGLHPRYLESFTPAVAACVGAGVALLARGRARVPVTAAFAVLLAAGLLVSARAVSAHTTDSGRPGFIPPARVAALSAFLRAHDAGTTDEVASVAPSKAAQLVALDGRPVRVLASVDGRPLVTPRALAADVAAGRVRFALLGDRCLRPGTAACAPAALWVRAHGIDVSAAAGQPHPGLVYRLGRRARVGTPTTVPVGTSSASPAGAPRARRRSSGPRRRARRAAPRARSARVRA